ncbi:MAG: gamma-glutamylcyclotransferase [Ardenticatenaceae bacterium]|nr:gamma-glutamylcyclotransferase [Ardenticatenaceae bacterium]
MDGRSKQDELRLPIFVYGTLLPGQPNAFLWQGLETGVENAQLRNGRLYNMGGYPMLVETGVDSVQGQIITIAVDFYEVVLARMDFLEGYDPLRPEAARYRRVVREVTLANGRSTTAWVYVGQMAFVNGRVPIPDGNWTAYFQQGHTTLLPSSHTRHQQEH